jgi:hypothetical protein
MPLPQVSRELSLGFANQFVLAPPSSSHLPIPLKALEDMYVILFSVPKIYCRIASIAC